MLLWTPTSPPQTTTAVVSKNAHSVTVQVSFSLAWPRGGGRGRCVPTMLSFIASHSDFTQFNRSKTWHAYSDSSFALYSAYYMYIFPSDAA